jgi:hypothetical protein
MCYSMWTADNGEGVQTAHVCVESTAVRPQCSVPVVSLSLTMGVRLYLKSYSFVSLLKYEGRLKSSCTHLITPSRNFVEVQWRSLFRITSLGKRCTSYNAPHTSRKRAADRWSFRNLLPRNSLFMVGEAQKYHGTRSGVCGGCSNGVPPIHFFQAMHRI